MVNLFNPEWAVEATSGHMRLRALPVGVALGAKRLGATYYELEPGCAVSPLHFHHGNEEMLVVVSGHPTVRGAEDERECEPGEVVAFPAGPAGTHQVVNRTQENVRVLLVSTMQTPDVAEHPESGKVLAIAAGDLHAFRRADKVSPTEGELPEPPAIRPIGPGLP
jgi:uncharacterized cupin superfamily protein